MLDGKEKIHFIGIGGIGMSGLAEMLLSIGSKVSGSDLNETEVTKRLRERGANIHIGHSSNNINKGIDLAVVSTAIPQDNEELAKCRELNIKIIHRGDMLANLMNPKKGIAISGSHGKTTTTAMMGLVLEECLFNPSILIGGDVTYLNGNAKLGTGDLFVAEADESDGSFLKLDPYISIVTNIEDDHLDYYGTEEKIKEAFAEFLAKAHEGTAIIWADDPNYEAVSKEVHNKITYGIANGDIRANNLRFSGLKSYADISYHDKKLGQLTLNVPGRHNIMNALAVISTAIYLGLDFEQVAQALNKFKGVKRRFEIIGQARGLNIVDDYAHHPTEISTTLEAARQVTKGKVICIFQPHRYTRTKQLYREFAKCFGNADVVIIDDVYAAGEKSIPDVDSRLILELLPHEHAYHCGGKEKIIEKAMNIANPGDLIITMGAGDVWKTAVELVSKLSKAS